MHVNQGMVPPNGPHFPVDNDVVLKAPTFELLYAQIVSYRVNRGIDPGDPVRDVNNYFCTKWPHVCLEDSTDGPRPEDAKSSMGKRVATWTALMARNQPQGGYSLADDGVAASRATTCSTCRYNRKWDTNCAPCWASINQVLGQIRRLRNVRMDMPVWGCEVDGSDNRTSAFLPEGSIKGNMVEATRYPPACWKTKLG